MVESLDLSPPFFATESQFEHHGQDRLFCEASPSLIGPVANRSKCRLDRVGRSNVEPMLCRKVIESQERLPILEVLRGLWVFGLVGFKKRVERFLGVVSPLSIGMKIPPFWGIEISPPPR